MALAARVGMGHRYFGGFDTSVYWRGVRDFTGGVNPYVVKEFVTPPSGLVAMLPMRLANFPTTYWVMQIITTAALVSGMYVALRELLTISEVRAVVVALAVVAVSEPTFTTIGFGSLNGVMFLAFALSLRSYARGEDRGAGLWLGVSLALKPLLAPFFLLFVIQRRWRAAGWSFAPVVIGSVVALAINAEVIHFVDEGLPNIFVGLENRFVRFNITVTSFAKVAHLSTALGTLGRVAAMALMVGVAYFVYRSHQRRGSALVLEWVDVGSVLFAGTLLTSSFAWRYYVVFLFPLFVRAARENSLARQPLVWAGALLAALPDGIGFADTLPQRAAVGRHTLGVGLVLLGIGWNALRQQLGAEPPTANS